MKGTDQVYVDNGAETFRGDGFGRCNEISGSAADRKTYGAELVATGLNRSPYRGVVADIGHCGKDRCSHCLKFLAARFETFRRSATYPDTCAKSGERCADRQVDAAAAAGNEGNLSVENAGPEVVGDHFQQVSHPEADGDTGLLPATFPHTFGWLVRRLIGFIACQGDGNWPLPRQTMRGRSCVAERVKLTVTGRVAEVRLNRPEKLNALDFGTFDEIIEVGNRLTTMEGLRSVVLAGEGRSFSVGIDLGALGDEGATILSSLATRTHGNANLFQRCALQWRDLAIPVIAAIQGHALGGGMQLALGADIRIVAPDAKLSIREMAWGLIPDMAGTVILSQLVRNDVMRDLLFSGRIISGDEAVAIGLATRVAEDPVGAAHALAHEFALHSPDAMRAAKRLANAGAAGASVCDMLMMEATEQQELLASFNHREAIEAHAEKRRPAFRG